YRIHKLFAGLYAEAMIPDLLAIAAAWQPDAIVREVAEFGGCVAAELLGIPHASVRSNTMLSSDFARDVVRSAMRRLRSRHRLPPDPADGMLFRSLHLAFEPPGFADPSRPLPATAHLVRPVVFSSSGAEVLPPWAGELGGPVIYATLGTVFNTRTPG